MSRSSSEGAHCGDRLDLTTARGVWVVHSTSAVTYWLDVDAKTVMRLPGTGSASAGCDAAWVPLLKVTSHQDAAPDDTEAIRVGAHHDYLTRPLGGLAPRQWRDRGLVTAIESVTMTVAPAAHPRPPHRARPAVGSTEEALLTRSVSAVLGPTLTATLAGAVDVRAVTVWEYRNGRTPPQVAARRLRTAERAFTTIAADCGADVARAWFIGGNPLLGGTPVSAIRNDHHDRVLAAAHALVEGQPDI